jgi:hypothetical protein
MAGHFTTDWGDIPLRSPLITIVDQVAIDKCGNFQSSGVIYQGMMRTCIDRSPILMHVLSKTDLLDLFT